MGLLFIKSPERVDGYAMTVVNIFIAFLYLLMMVKSPFETVAAAPADGSGMNPLLQNPWMVVHPPLLFVGYAAMVFPFALVVSALARRNYGNWFESGFAWTLFSSLALGAGIIIGGFWAYEVLGWGGFWGWDPVENSSLVPWLVLLALVHGLLVQKTKGSLVRTNIFLAAISFLFVLYATFLTRSGVLADFSVHSFVDLGINNYLIGAMVAGVSVSMGLFATRFFEIRSPKLDFSRMNRELGLALGVFVLCAGAVFTFVGMSSPIFTGFIGKASQVDTSFYNKVNLPVAIGISLLLGITPFFGWTEEKSSLSRIARRLSMPLALTALACVIAYVAGVDAAMLMIFVGSASFALISNSIVAFRQYKSGWMGLGGPVAHIGVALLLIGIIGSGKFDRTTQLVLDQGKPLNIYGYQVTFTGVDEHAVPKPEVHLEVSDGRNSYHAAPKLYFSETNQSMMREPDIKIYPLQDLYISPIELKLPAAAHAQGQVYELAKGDTKDIGGYKITFARFDMNGQHGEPGEMSVGAILDVDAGGKTHEVIPQLSFNASGQRKLMPAEMPALDPSATGIAGPKIALNAISVEEKKVLVELLGMSEVSTAENLPQIIVEISTKPLMMVVWTGVILIIGGTAVSLKRRTTSEIK
jgi:cytochrome c-type biogenesis protein CcmF